MKFAIVVVMLALALGAQSSILPYGPYGPYGLGLGLGYGLSYTAVNGPAFLPAGPSLYTQGPFVAPAAVPAALAAPVAPYGPSVANHVGLVPGATYVAKTRGAVHTAPLAGHLNSAASINLLPAPGTI